MATLEYPSIRLALESALDDVPPDLFRRENGYSVSALYLPTLEHPTTARVSVDVDGFERETVTVPAWEALEAFTHPTFYCAQLASVLA